MKQAIMKRWVKALRSGKYRQTTEKLRAATKNGNPANRFCCLGVLCDLFAQDHPKAGWCGDDGRRGRCLFAADMKNTHAKDTNGQATACAELLPACVQRWAGLKSKTGIVHKSQLTGTAIGGEGSFKLSDLNDNSGRNFKEIASIVETYWRKL